MDNNDLQHHGILGMRWGVRRTPAQLGYKTSTDKAKARAKKITADAKEEAKKIKLREKNKAIVDNAKAKAEIIKGKAKGVVTKESSNSKPKTKSMSEMTDDELRSAIARKELENKYKSLMPKEKQKFMSRFTDEALKPAAISAGKKVLEKLFTDKAMSALGLDDAPKDALSKLKKEAEKAGYEKQIAEAEIMKKRAKGDSGNSNSNENKGNKLKDKASETGSKIKDKNKDKVDERAERKAAKKEERAERKAAEKEERAERKAAEKEERKRNEAEYVRNVLDMYNPFKKTKKDDSDVEIVEPDDSAWRDEVRSTKKRATKGESGKTYKMTAKPSDPEVSSYKSSGKDIVDRFRTELTGDDDWGE